MVKKSKKSVKKYAVGGDMRVSNECQMPFDKGAFDHVIPEDEGSGWGPGGGFGGGGYDQSATGQVRQISDSARRAADRLRGAGEAQQQAGAQLGNTEQGGRGVLGNLFPSVVDIMPQYKKGGKVKKPAKKAARTSAKVRGAGRVIKGVRPAKMIKMKGS